LECILETKAGIIGNEQQLETAPLPATYLSSAFLPYQTKQKFADPEP